MTADLYRGNRSRVIGCFLWGGSHAMAHSSLSGAPERRRSSSALGAYRDQGAAFTPKIRSRSRLRGLDTVLRCASDLPFGKLRTPLDRHSRGTAFSLLVIFSDGACVLAACPPRC